MSHCHPDGMATSTWDSVRDEKGGEDREDVPSASEVGPCGSSYRDAFTEVILGAVERDTQDSPHRAKLEDRSATRLTVRVFPVSRSRPRLSPPPFCFPQRSLQHRFTGRVDFLLAPSFLSFPT